MVCQVLYRESSFCHDLANIMVALGNFCLWLFESVKIFYFETTSPNDLWHIKNVVTSFTEIPHLAKSMATICNICFWFFFRSSPQKLRSKWCMWFPLEKLNMAAMSNFVFWLAEKAWLPWTIIFSELQSCLNPSNAWITRLSIQAWMGLLFWIWCELLVLRY